MRCRKAAVIAGASAWNNLRGRLVLNKVVKLVSIPETVTTVGNDVYFDSEVVFIDVCNQYFTDDHLKPLSFPKVKTLYIRSQLFQPFMLVNFKGVDIFVHEWYASYKERIYSNAQASYKYGYVPMLDSIKVITSTEWQKAFDRYRLTPTKARKYVAV